MGLFGELNPARLRRTASAMDLRAWFCPTTLFSSDSSILSKRSRSPLIKIWHSDLSLLQAGPGKKKGATDIHGNSGRPGDHQGDILRGNGITEHQSLTAFGFIFTGLQLAGKLLFQFRDGSISQLSSLGQVSLSLGDVQLLFCVFQSNFDILDLLQFLSGAKVKGQSEKDEDKRESRIFTFPVATFL